MRQTISAKFLLADPAPATTVIPAGFAVKRLPAKVAAGARKPRSGAMGGSLASRELGRLVLGRAPLLSYAAKVR